MDKGNIPCVNCLTVVICKNRIDESFNRKGFNEFIDDDIYNNYDEDIDNFIVITILEHTDYCSLIKDYLDSFAGDDDAEEEAMFEIFNYLDKLK